MPPCSPQASRSTGPDLLYTFAGQLRVALRFPTVEQLKSYEISAGDKEVMLLRPDLWCVGMRFHYVLV
jgi:hypothetical protein